MHTGQSVDSLYINLFYGVWTLNVESLYVKTPLRESIVVGIFSPLVVGDFIEDFRNRRQEVPLALLHLGTDPGLYKLKDNWFEINNNSDAVSFYIKDIESKRKTNFTAHLHVTLRRSS